MTEIETVIKNRAGIHARPASMIVQAASKYRSKIYLQNGPDRVNAKSIMGIITLGAGYDSKIRIQAEGEDEESAAAAIERLFTSRFEEE